MTPRPPTLADRIGALVLFCLDWQPLLFTVLAFILLAGLLTLGGAHVLLDIVRSR